MNILLISSHFLHLSSKCNPQNRFLKHLTLCASIETYVRDQVSHPHKITDYIVVLTTCIGARKVR
jgi:hypothetical protein